MKLKHQFAWQLIKCTCMILAKINKFTLNISKKFRHHAIYNSSSSFWNCYKYSLHVTWPPRQQGGDMNHYWRGTTLLEYQVSLKSDYHTIACKGRYPRPRGHWPNIILTFLGFLDNLFSNEWNELPKMKNELWIITLIFLVSKDLCLPNAPPNFRKDRTKGSRDTAALNSQEEPKSCMCILSTVMRTGASISFLWCSLER